MCMECIERNRLYIGKRSDAAKLLFQKILRLNKVKHSFPCKYR